MRAKTINENYFESVNDLYAVSFDIEKNYGGDVDFNESEFEIKSVTNFFNDKEFMEKIENVIDDFIDSGWLTAFEIRTPEDLKNFFDWSAESESFVYSSFDAMPKSDYDHYMEELDKDEDDEW